MGRKVTVYGYQFKNGILQADKEQSRFVQDWACLGHQKAGMRRAARAGLFCSEELAPVPGLFLRNPHLYSF